MLFALSFAKVCVIMNPYLHSGLVHPCLLGDPFEPREDKTNKISVRPAKTSAKSDQSSLCAQWVTKDPSFLHADSEDSDQTGRKLRLI